MMLSRVQAITIPEGDVREISVGGRVLWKKPVAERYTALEYIEGTGVQYIDTGIPGRSDIEIYLDYEFTKFVGTNILFGVHNTAANIRIYTAHGKGYIGYGRNTIMATLTPKISTRYDTYTKLYDSAQTLDVNGENVANKTIEGAVDSGLNCYLNALNYNGSALYHGYAKIYACKILVDGALVRDFMPCRRESDGAVGMYDCVSETFFGNAGTGAFAAGAFTYTDIAGLQFSGEQLIETGYTPNDKTCIEVGLMRTVSDTEYLFGVASEDGLASVAAELGSNAKWYFGGAYCPQTLTVGKRFDMVMDSSGLLKNTYSYKYRGTVGTFVSPHPIIIGGCTNADGTHGEPQFSGVLYNFRILEDGVTVRDYVPKQRSDGAYGLWDNISGTFSVSTTGTAFTEYVETEQEEV